MWKPRTFGLQLRWITEPERIRDYDRLGDVLAAYRAEGIRFALDDVGEGHSTLELLAALGSEYLNLRRSLTMTSSRMGSKEVIYATGCTRSEIGGCIDLDEFVALRSPLLDRMNRHDGS